jgi:hypothetical protein
VDTLPATSSSLNTKKNTSTLDEKEKFGILAPFRPFLEIK